MTAGLVYWYAADGVVLTEAAEYELDADVTPYCTALWGDFPIWFDGVEDSVFDPVAPVKAPGPGAAEDDKYPPLPGIGVTSFCWARYRGKIGFAVVLSAADFAAGGAETFPGVLVKHENN